MDSVMPRHRINSPFLGQIMAQAGLEDEYDARDVTEVVFRTMRDLMSNDVTLLITQELQQQAVATDSDAPLDAEIVKLWQDTNPLVAWLSRLRPPLEFDDETFVFRISQEAGLSKGVQPLPVIVAVFAALKQHLSQARQADIQQALPGDLKEFWQTA